MPLDYPLRECCGTPVDSYHLEDCPSVTVRTCGCRCNCGAPDERDERRIDRSSDTKSGAWPGETDARTVAMHEAVDWDDRKVLATLWQEHVSLTTGGLSPEFYEALIAVAQWGGGRVYDNLRDDNQHSPTEIAMMDAHVAESDGLTLTDFLLARYAEEEAAKRLIVEWCSERDRIWVGSWGGDLEDARPQDFVPGPLAHPVDSVVLRFLALPYADHPDYRDEWKP